MTRAKPAPKRVFVGVWDGRPIDVCLNPKETPMESSHYRVVEYVIAPKRAAKK